jgi:hypothetical protein
MATRKQIVKRVLFAILFVVLAIAAVPGYWIARATLFAEKFDVTSIEQAPRYQDEALLARASALEVASTYQLAWQTNGSVCGPSSIANVVRSLGREASEDSVLEGSGLCWTGMCMGGITLDEAGGLARRATGRRVSVLRDLDLAGLRRELARANDPGRRYIVNFHRGPLFGRGGGHHSPIGGYLVEEDLVYVLDVNQEYGPWLTSSERLFAAIDTVDPSSGRKRGLLRIE